jgi:hypothetical protein
MIWRPEMSESPDISPELREGRGLPVRFTSESPSQDSLLPLSLQHARSRRGQVGPMPRLSDRASILEEPTETRFCDNLPVWVSLHTIIDDHQKCLVTAFRLK